MHVAVGLLARERGVLQVRGNSLGLGNLLGFQTVSIKHVLEVHVAADVELHGALQAHATVFKKLRHHAVSNGGTNLGLNVIADNRNARIRELLRPLGVGGNKDRQGVDESTAGIDSCLRVVLIGFFRTHWQVGDNNVSTGVLECLNDIDRLSVRFFNRLQVVTAQTIQGHAALHRDTNVVELSDGDGAVAGSAGGIRKILAHLGRIHIEGSNKLNIANMVVTELGVHEAGNFLLDRCVAVILHALDERSCTVANTNDGNLYFRGH